MKGANDGCVGKREGNKMIDWVGMTGKVVVYKLITQSESNELLAADYQVISVN